MTTPDATWSALVTVKTRGERLAGMLEQSLRPEAEREVPRTKAELRRSSLDSLELSISARDSGAMRAALNTYLGWVHLSVATVRSGSGSPAPADRPPEPTP
jgi:tRNA threonylcarbamoyladenosine modification (KEOPS) complex  Pcc1 subunit